MEVSIILIISCFLGGAVLGVRHVINKSKLANAINLTAQFDFLEDDSLVLWLETSKLTENNKPTNIDFWNDLSKNRIEFKCNSGNLLLSKSNVCLGIGSLKFDGTNYLESSTPLNLSQYTAFVVAKQDESNLNSSLIFDSGFIIESQNIGNNKIIVLKNNGSTKYKKALKESSFITISSSDDLVKSKEKKEERKLSPTDENIELEVINTLWGSL